MSVLERLKRVVSRVFEIPEEEVTCGFASDSTEKWDSLGHLMLISAIEDEFGIKYRTEEIPELDSIESIIGSLEAKLPETDKLNLKDAKDIKPS